MAQRFYPTERYLPAKMLIHDVAEAYYGDVSAPLKSLLPDYRTLEANANAAVERRFDLGFVGDPLVKEVDDRMWLTERMALFDLPTGEDYLGDLEAFPLTRGEFKADFLVWLPWTAEKRFDLALLETLPWVKW